MRNMNERREHSDSTNAVLEEAASVIASELESKAASNVTIGEAVYVAQKRHGRGTLAALARMTGAKKSTLYECHAVVRFYGGNDNGDISVGNSLARDLLTEFPVLGWTRLREAMSAARSMGLDDETSELAEAIRLLMWYVENMTSEAEWYSYLNKKASRPLREIRIERGGLTVIIRRRL